MGKRVYDWKAIQQYHDEGHGFRECHERFGMAHATWKSAIAKGLLIPRGRCVPQVALDARRRYDWAEVQAYYDEGHSFRQCQAHFGFSSMTWHKARLRGELKTRPVGMPIERLLRTSPSRHAVKMRLLNAGILLNVCDECGIREWRDKPLTMHLDHINGVKNDHRLDNLRMLCPNCHSQTETYGGRNMKRRRRLQDVEGTV